jgi:hypothetical protein
MAKERQGNITTLTTMLANQAQAVEVRQTNQTALAVPANNVPHTPCMCQKCLAMRAIEKMLFPMVAQMAQAQGISVDELRALMT